MTKLQQIPEVEHYALVTLSTTNIHHDGDERSRTNPGHGYPAYTETIESIDYKSFASQEELSSYLQRRFKTDGHYRIFKVIPLRATTTLPPPTHSISSSVAPLSLGRNPTPDTEQTTREAGLFAAAFGRAFNAYELVCLCIWAAWCWNAQPPIWMVPVVVIVIAGGSIAGRAHVAARPKP